MVNGERKSQAKRQTIVAAPSAVAEAMADKVQVRNRRLGRHLMTDS
jgi:hypothetical protein